MTVISLLKIDERNLAILCRAKSNKRPVKPKRRLEKACYVAEGRIVIRSNPMIVMRSNPMKKHNNNSRINYIRLRCRSSPEISNVWLRLRY